MISFSYENATSDELRYRAAEFYEKLGALLNVLDAGIQDISENDKAALIWAALDYHELLGKVMRVSAMR